MKHLFRNIAAFLVAVCVLTANLNAFAASIGGEYVILTIDLNNGTYQSFWEVTPFEDEALSPFIDENGNVMIPIRFLEEAAITAGTVFEADTGEITLITMDLDRTFRLGSPDVEMDGVGYEPGTVLTMIDAAGNPVAPQIINERAYLPLRALMITAMGCSRVEYSQGVVTVYSNY
jgi:hypothetical protein